MMIKSLISSNHTSTTRDYLARVNEVDKATASELACRWEVDYWDGDRSTGYGGYYYDGRWRKVARKIIAEYSLKPGMSVLDIGCGKGFLLKDLQLECPGLKVKGIDVSNYALEHAEPEVKDQCVTGNATSLPFEDNCFDLVISVNTLHNLLNFELDAALLEIKRVKKEHSFICVEAYRNEKEKVNLLYWQLTCRAFLSPAEWLYLFNRIELKTDYEFIYFE
jgi:ubiquinone/menaquinone biosynthesis C-methylase UbiE